MSLSMYQASVPVLLRNLNNLSAILKKAEAHAALKKIELDVFANARLAPDMYPMYKQIQITTDVSKGGAARLAGVEVPSYPDTERTIPELQARITKTIDFIKSLKANQIDGSEERTINLKVGGQDLSFPGQAYLLHFVLPNIFFHVSIAYAILRHNGVELGKKDYLGGI
jgi:uncharacterized protein